MLRVLVLCLPLLMSSSVSMAGGREDFEKWMASAQNRFLTHGIWEDNVNAVLSAGILKPAELVVRETGVVSYEKGKKQGTRVRESISQD